MKSLTLLAGALILIVTATACRTYNVRTILHIRYAPVGERERDVVRDTIIGALGEEAFNEYASERRGAIVFEMFTKRLCAVDWFPAERRIEMRPFRAEKAFFQEFRNRITEGFARRNIEIDVCEEQYLGPIFDM